MPRVAKELTDAAVRALTKKKGMHRVGGVPGLALKVAEGRCGWVFRVWVGDKRKDYGLGAYPDTSLKEAREKARGVLAKLDAGIDPTEAKRAAKANFRAPAVYVQQRLGSIEPVGDRPTPPVMTFEEAAKQYIAEKVVHNGNDRHKAQWPSTLKEYAYPKIGKMDVADIDVPHIMDILKQETEKGPKGKRVKGEFWSLKNETAYRTLGRIEAVLDWCEVHKHRTGNNPARYRKFLDKVLPKPSQVKTVTHFEALPIEEVPSFMKKIAGQGGYGPKALAFTILTAARSGSVREMKWEQVDLDRKIWVIPASNMKGEKGKKRAFRVPLSDQAVALLKGTDKVLGTDYVFPSGRGEALSDMTLTACIRRLNLSCKVHGFRSTFSDWAATKTSHPRELRELCLAHVVKSKVEAAYQRDDLIEKRRPVMQDWADHCLPKLRAI